MQQQGEGNITKTPQIDRHFNAGESNISEPQTGTNTVQQQFRGAAQTSEDLYSLLREAIQQIQIWMDILFQDNTNNPLIQEVTQLMPNTLRKLQNDIDPPIGNVHEFNENIIDSPIKSSEQSNNSDALQILSNNKQFNNFHEKIKFLEDMLDRDKANLPPLSPPYTPTRQICEKLNDKQILYKQALSQIGSEVSELEINFKKHKEDAKILSETFAQDFQEFSQDSFQIQQQQLSVLDIPQQSTHLVSFEKSSLNDQYSEIKKNFKFSVHQLKQKYSKSVKAFLIAQQKKRNNQILNFKQEINQLLTQQKQEFTYHFANQLTRIVDMYKQQILEKDQESKNYKNQLQLLQSQIENQQLSEKNEQTNQTIKEQQIVNQENEQLKEEIKKLQKFITQLEKENQELKVELEISQNNYEGQILIQKKYQQKCEDLTEELQNIKNKKQDEQENENNQLKIKIEQLQQFNKQLVLEKQQLQQQQDQQKQKCENCIKQNERIEELERFQSQLDNLDSPDEDASQKKNNKKENKSTISEQNSIQIHKLIKFLKSKLKEEFNRNKWQLQNNLFNDLSTLFSKYNNLKIAFDATNDTIIQFQNSSKSDWLILKNENQQLREKIIDLSKQLNTLEQINQQQQNTLKEQQKQIAEQQNTFIIRETLIIQQTRDINELRSQNQGYYRQLIQANQRIEEQQQLINCKENEIFILKELQQQLQVSFIQGFNDLQGELQNIFNSQFKIVSEYYDYFNYNNQTSASQVKNQASRVFQFRIGNQNDFDKQFEMQKQELQFLRKLLIERQNAFVDTIERERNEDD